MYKSVWYNFFADDKQAIATFDYSFVDNDTLKVGGDYIHHFASSCFGSYGRMYEGYAERGKNDFYFALTAKHEQIEEAVNQFNSTFQNIKFRIVKKVAAFDVESRFGISVQITDGNIEEKITRYEKNSARKFLLTEDAPRKPYFVYLLNIEFNPEYNPLAKYILRIPLGFFIRMFSAYYGCLDIKEIEGDYIDNALEFSNSRPWGNGGYISDYIVSRELFLKMDNIEYVNFCFNKPLYKVKYIEGMVATLDYANSIVPYSVYFVLEHDGNTN